MGVNRPSLIWTRLIRSQVTWHIKSTVNKALAELKAQKCLLSVVTKIYIVSSVIRSPKFIMQKKSHHGMCNSSLDSSRVWARPRHCANPALKLSLKKAAKGTICPLQNLGKKTRKEAHTKRFSSVQKLQAKTEHGKYILSF